MFELNIVFFIPSIAVFAMWLLYRKFWFAEYINSLYGDMGVPFQARSRYFSRLAVLKLSWGNSWLTPRKLMNR